MSLAPWIEIVEAHGLTWESSTVDRVQVIADYIYNNPILMLGRAVARAGGASEIEIAWEIAEEICDMVE